MSSFWHRRDFMLNCTTANLQSRNEEDHMKVRYIAIEREYGSGGSTIAKRLAEECSINCYGREILEKAGENLHIPVSQLEKYEENTTNSVLYSVAIIGKVQFADPDMLMREGHSFVRLLSENWPPTARQFFWDTVPAMH